MSGTLFLIKVYANNFVLEYTTLNRGIIQKSKEFIILYFFKNNHS